MSANPQPNPDPSGRERAEASSLLASALTDKAVLHARIDRRTTEIESAKRQGADSFAYSWALADGREADISVFYRYDGSLDVLAVDLLRIDEQIPTMRERLELEEEFLAEIESGGSTWESLTSFIWERVHFQEGIHRS